MKKSSGAFSLSHSRKNSHGKLLEKPGNNETEKETTNDDLDIHIPGVFTCQRLAIRFGHRANEEGTNLTTTEVVILHQARLASQMKQPNSHLSAALSKNLKMKSQKGTYSRFLFPSFEKITKKPQEGEQYARFKPNTKRRLLDSDFVQQKVNLNVDFGKSSLKNLQRNSRKR